MNKFKNILAENMRRFGTKNLTEQTSAAPTGSVGTAYNAYDKLHQYTAPIGEGGEPIYVIDGKYSASESNLDSVMKYTKTKLLTKDEMKQYIKYNKSGITKDDTAFIQDTTSSTPILIKLRNLKPYKAESESPMSWYKPESPDQMEQTATRFIGRRYNLIPPYPYKPESE